MLDLNRIGYFVGLDYTSLLSTTFIYLFLADTLLVIDLRFSKDPLLELKVYLEYTKKLNRSLSTGLEIAKIAVRRRP